MMDVLMMLSCSLALFPFIKVVSSSWGSVHSKSQTQSSTTS